MFLFVCLVFCRLIIILYFGFFFVFLDKQFLFTWVCVAAFCIVWHTDILFDGCFVSGDVFVGVLVVWWIRSMVFVFFTIYYCSSLVFSVIYRFLSWIRCCFGPTYVGRFV